MLFFHDLRIAMRSLWRVRALWITVALTLALGIGANAAIFSVVRAVLLRPLVNRDENRLLYLRQSAPGLGEENATFSIPEIDDLGQGLKTIQQLGTFSAIDFTLVGLGTPREIPAGVVDGHYFEVMGLRPVLGRLLTPADDGPNATGAVVLTYRFWNASLHADPSVIGRRVRLESFSGARSATIVGVLEPSMPYPVATEIIANVVTSPHHLSATMVTGREHRMTEVFARLAPGATLEQARSELRTRYAAIMAAHPEIYKSEDHYRIDVTRMHDQINSRANTILWVLFAASGLLFVIACSNVANLVLARTVRRESELAVRSALGASTAALRRALLAESLVLCGSGVIAALLLAWPMVVVLGHYAARFSVRADGLTLDFTLVWFGVALALVAAVFLALVPRLPSASAGQGVSLASGGTRVTGSSNGRLRMFAVMQITASFLLLTGAAVLMRTLYTLEMTRPPFDTSRVLAVNLPVMSYGRTPEQVREFYREVQRRVSALPGVAHVANGFSVPWRDDQALDISFAFAAQGAVPKNGLEDWRAKFRSVSSGYFDTLGVPLTEGRDFRDSDRSGSERVVIVSQSLAQKLFPGQDALNHELRWTDGVMKFIGISMEPRRIVGVVPDLDDENIIPSPEMMVYQPADQEGWEGRLFVRTKQDPYTVAPLITRTIHEISSEQPVEHASTLQDIRAEVMTPDKLNALVFGGFAAVALLISVVGVAGVLAFSVSGRIREFGIRMALGAQPRNILTDVLLQGLTIAAIGVCAGAVFGIVFARGVDRFVAGVHRPGMLSFLVSALVILAAAVIASAVPAARAARVNAAEALRSE
ncbi:ADOP family duplicated permease [Paracidobacterium acidisoli]|uniref:Multidrug ABC transporter substrate-binding protein n=1 Tax=Paracidobacterium acidisoli TaxID=2303751 RepID=A0A372ITF4_9BACT|nr:ADOP family duplicated permease [Paracidobacterium acidisoli]MBT9329579.1 ABC transporter permease [Paracidobacterium acidisoli]